MDTMSRSKIAAFFREFPRLEVFVNENDVHSVRVSRVDRDLMAKVPEDEPVNCLFQDHVLGQYTILDKNCGRMTSVGIRLVENKWWWGGFLRKKIFRSKHFEETVGDAIARLGDRVEMACFVLHCSPTDRALTLYKSPKGFSIKGWLEEEIRQEQAKIQDEVQAIDALASHALACR